MRKETAEWYEAWKEERREEGREQGRREALAAVLREQLAQRFGPTPEHVEQRIATATSAELERWAVRFAKAESIDEIFGG